MDTGGRFSKAKRSPADFVVIKMPERSELADVKAVRETINAVVTEAVKETAQNVSREVFVNTPKETTFTASNWNISVGTEDTEVRNLYQARRQREQMAKEVESSYKYNPSAPVAVFITNPTNHIVELNARGSSRLGVPAGFVQRGVAAGLRATGPGLRRRLRRGFRRPRSRGGR